MNERSSLNSITDVIHVLRIIWRPRLLFNYRDDSGSTTALGTTWLAHWRLRVCKARFVNTVVHGNTEVLLLLCGILCGILCVRTIKIDHSLVKYGVGLVRLHTVVCLEHGMTTGLKWASHAHTHLVVSSLVRPRQEYQTGAQYIPNR